MERIYPPSHRRLFLERSGHEEIFIQKERCMNHCARNYPYLHGQRNTKLCDDCTERGENSNRPGVMSLVQLCMTVLMMKNLVVPYMKLNNIPLTLLKTMETEALNRISQHFPKSCLPLLRSRRLPKENVFQLFYMSRGLNVEGKWCDGCNEFRSHFMFFFRRGEGCRTCRLVKRILNRKLLKINFLPFRVAKWNHRGKTIKNVTLELRANFFRFGCSINRDNGKLTLSRNLSKYAYTRSRYMPYQTVEVTEQTSHSSQLMIYPVISDKMFSEHVLEYYKRNPFYPELFSDGKSTEDMINLYRENQIWPFSDNIFQHNGLIVEQCKSRNQKK